MSSLPSDASIMSGMPLSSMLCRGLNHDAARAPDLTSWRDTNEILPVIAELTPPPTKLPLTTPPPASSSRPRLLTPAAPASPPPVLPEAGPNDGGGLPSALLSEPSRSGRMLNSVASRCRRARGDAAALPNAEPDVGGPPLVSVSGRTPSATGPPPPRCPLPDCAHQLVPGLLSESLPPPRALAMRLTLTGLGGSAGPGRLLGSSVRYPLPTASMVRVAPVFTHAAEAAALSNAAATAAAAGAAAAASASCNVDRAAREAAAARLAVVRQLCVARQVARKDAALHRRAARVLAPRDAADGRRQAHVPARQVLAAQAGAHTSVRRAAERAALGRLRQPAALRTQAGHLRGRACVGRRASGARRRQQRRVGERLQVTVPRVAAAAYWPQRRARPTRQHAARTRLQGHGRAVAQQAAHRVHAAVAGAAERAGARAGAAARRAAVRLV
eukprot:66230-Chlamydomonas_euryale.AAC.2